jgi:hypothetical protein
MNHAPPALMREEDYEAIEAAVMETARGRWFLAEFARRNRSVDTTMVLEAVSRVERIAAGISVHQPMAALRDEVSVTRNLVESMRADFAMHRGDIVRPRDIGALKETVERALDATLARLAETTSQRDVAALRTVMEQVVGVTERSGRELVTEMRAELSGTKGALAAIRAELLARLGEGLTARDLAGLRDTIERVLGSGERGPQEALAGLHAELAAARGAIDALRDALAERVADATTPRELTALREGIERSLGTSERTGRELALTVRDELGAARSALETAHADLTARVDDITSRLSGIVRTGDVATLGAALERAVTTSEQLGRDVMTAVREEFERMRSSIEATRVEMISRLGEVAGPRDIKTLREAIDKVNAAAELAGQHVVIAVERVEERLTKAVARVPVEVSSYVVPAPKTEPPVRTPSFVRAPQPADDDVLEPVDRAETLEPPSPGRPSQRERGATRPAPMSIGSSALAIDESEPQVLVAARSDRLDFGELSFAEKAALFS